MKIPKGICVAWPGSNTRALLPSGWTRLTALDSRHTRGANDGADAGGTGGSSGHGHPSDPHSHGAGPSHTHAAGTAPDYPPAVPSEDYFTIFPSSTVVSIHHHSTPATGSAATAYGPGYQGGGLGAPAAWDLLVTEVEYFSVLWLQSDGTPTGVPDHALAYWASTTLPLANWGQHAGSAGRFLRGALTNLPGGASGGAATHTHTNAPHAHLLSAHTHTLSSGSSGVAVPVVFTNNVVHITTDPPGQPAPTLGHTHTLTIQSATETTSPTASGAIGSSGVDPANTELAVIQNTSGLAVIQKDAVLVWFGKKTDIPYGWRLCDGTDSTVDLREQFVKAAALMADVGTVNADASTHTHSNPGTHIHTDPGDHVHPLSETTNGVISVPLLFGLGVGAPANTFEPHIHGMVTGPDSAGGSTLSADLEDVVTVAIDARPVFSDVLFVAMPGEMAITLTAPADGATVTVDNPTATWTIPGGETQLSFTLNVYADDGVTVVYTSGLQTTATQSWTVPATHIRQNKHYKFQVSVLSTTFDLGLSTVNRILALFTPSPAVADLTATPVNNGTPPNVLLAWTEGTISGGQSYVQTNIERRVHGSGDAWQVISFFTPITTVTYRDYTAIPGIIYDYAVTTTTLYGLDDLVSLEQASPPSATLSFPGVWLHRVADPSQYLNFPMATDTAQPSQDMRLVPAWGRQEPTAHIGEQNAQEWSIVGAPSGYPRDGSRPAGVDAWAALKAFVDAARTSGRGGVLMYRFGNMEEGAYVVINWSKTSRAGGIGIVTPTLVVQQVYFDPSGGG